MPAVKRLLALSPAKIGASYLLFGGLWILLSDRLVLAVSQSPEVATQLQTIKGWLFVLLSGLLLIGLTRTREQQLDRSQRRLLKASQELQVLQRVFRHNIRNDLNVIQGYADLLREQLGGSEAEDDLATISRTANGIVQMSDKIGIIERADIKLANDETVDIAAVVRDELSRLLERHPDVSVTADLPDHSRIYGDRSLTYAIRELLENAVEHHVGPSDECRIAVDVDQSLNAVAIRVADNGPGIPLGELEAIERGGESPLTHVSGVGLWLVTWLTELYGGDVDFDMGEAGTTVTLDFQAASPVELLAQQTPIEMVASAEG